MKGLAETMAQMSIKDVVVVKFVGIIQHKTKNNVVIVEVIVVKQKNVNLVVNKGARSKHISR